MDMEKNHDSFFDCYFQLLNFEKNFRQFTQCKVGNDDLTLANMMLLSYLYVNGSCGQKELTVTFNASSAAMAVSIARLEEKNLINKVVDPEDKRNNIISLTEEGENCLLLFKKTCDAQKKENAESTNDFCSPEELRNLIRLQKKLSLQLKTITDIVRIGNNSVE
ncbi:MAG: MarR family transcriptional regulator [Firmicutes bacterium]|nr:MarR family transcriptional regulator [Bacillota bacterium]